MTYIFLYCLCKLVSKLAHISKNNLLPMYCCNTNYHLRKRKFGFGGTPFKCKVSETVEHNASADGGNCFLRCFLLSNRRRSIAHCIMWSSKDPWRVNKKRQLGAYKEDFSKTQWRECILALLSADCGTARGWVTAVSRQNATRFIRTGRRKNTDLSADFGWQTAVAGSI